MQAEDGIRVAQESRGLGDVYKRQLVGGRSDLVERERMSFAARDRRRLEVAARPVVVALRRRTRVGDAERFGGERGGDVAAHRVAVAAVVRTCLLYTSDAADDLLCVDLGGRRCIKKKNTLYNFFTTLYNLFYQKIQ